MTGPTEEPRRGTRDRYRDRVREEVKDAALRQLEDGGAQAVSVNAIAKELGVSGPALYRYFVNRDELLGELVLDAYGDLAEALAFATSDDRLAPSDRFRAWAHAYRRWALHQPHRYVLLHRQPAPGFAAHAEPLVEAARATLRSLTEVLAGATPDPASRGMAVWARVHGLLDLELAGMPVAMGLDPDELFVSEVEAALRSG